MVFIKNKLVNKVFRTSLKIKKKIRLSFCLTFLCQHRECLVNISSRVLGTLKLSFNKIDPL